MVSVTIAPAIQWLVGSPLWSEATDAVLDGRDDTAMRRPALLRFGSDTFMDDLAGILEQDPGRVTELRARPVSYRRPPIGAPEDWEPSVDRLKLYQAFHGDFNLVAASLVCRKPGMPDHTVEPGDEESVSFVMRRVERDADGGAIEFAWVDDGVENGRPRHAWLPVPAEGERAVAAGEQTFPMFPMSYTRGIQPRRLFAGVVPVSSGETFKSAGHLEPFPERPGTEPGAAALAEDDARWVEFDRLVVHPLADLTDPVRTSGLTADDLVEASQFLLLDFADFLQRYLPAFWAALRSGTRPAPTAQAALYDLLDAAVAPGMPAWRVALVNAWDQALRIAGEEGPDPTLDVSIKGTPLKVDVPEDQAPAGDSLQERVRALLPPGAPAAEAAEAAEAAGAVGSTIDEPVAKLEPTGQAEYRIRCVYRRPRCEPLPVDLVSDPTDDFVISPLFDPDAPVRQIRIPLPIDTSVRDLRKFRNNVGFVLSNQMRAQMNRVTDLKKALDGDLGEAEEWDLGMLCQLSIPIITICALMLLFVILGLLNIVFFWMPFFRICLPIPVRGKQ